MLAAIYVSIALVVSLPGLANSSAQNRNRINGRVATGDDKPIEGIRVTLLSDSLTQTGVDYTDSSGRFSFENLARGIYSVLVEPSPEYERQSLQVEVNPYMPTGQGGSETYRIDFVLKPAMSKRSQAISSDRIVFYQDVPSGAKKEYRRALEALKKGDTDGAARLLGRAIEIFPDYYNALEVLGTERVKAREYQLAIPILSRAIEVNQDDWRSYYSLGIALVEVKRTIDAIKPLRKAVELNPGWAYTHMRLGVALGQSDETRVQAIDALKEAVRLGGEKLPEAFLHLASACNRNGQYQEAVVALESYLRAAKKADQQPADIEYYESLLEQLRKKASAPKKRD